MNEVIIVTDSSVRFQNTWHADPHQIIYAPAAVRFGETLVEDSPTADLTGAMSLFDGSAFAPRFIPPSVEQFEQIYRGLLGRTDKIISVHTSGKLSQATANATAASQQFLGRCNIQVIDSESVSTGLGLLVQAASDAIADKMEFDDVVRVIRGMIPRLYMVSFLDDLTYLERNGLVTRSQAILGNMMGVIAFLTLEEGKLIPMEKVRSRARAIEKLTEFVSEFSILSHLSILESSSTPSEEARGLVERIRLIHPDTPIGISCYGPSLATLVGINSLGVVVLEQDGAVE
jgi:fatty acid kinase fatty acid binding subunit